MGLCRAFVYFGAAAAVAGGVHGRSCSRVLRSPPTWPGSPTRRVRRASIASAISGRWCCWRAPMLARAARACAGRSGDRHLSRADRLDRLCGLPAGEAPDARRGAARGRRADRRHLAGRCHIPGRYRRDHAGTASRLPVSPRPCCCSATSRGPEHGDRGLRRLPAWRLCRARSRPPQSTGSTPRSTGSARRQTSAASRSRSASRAARSDACELALDRRRSRDGAAAARRLAAGTVGRRRSRARPDPRARAIAAMIRRSRARRSAVHDGRGDGVHRLSEGLCDLSGAEAALRAGARGRALGDHAGVRGDRLPQSLSVRSLRRGRLEPDGGEVRVQRRADRNDRRVAASAAIRRSCRCCGIWCRSGAPPGVRCRTPFTPMSIAIDVRGDNGPWRTDAESDAPWCVTLSAQVWLIVSATAPAVAGDAQRGEPMYQRYCTGCHGADGRGGGKNFMPHVGALTRKGYTDRLEDSYLEASLRKAARPSARAPTCRPSRRRCRARTSPT